MRAAVIAVVVLAAGCQFDSTLPSSTAVACTTDAQCAGIAEQCHPRLLRCVDRFDTEAPLIESATFAPSALKVGARSTVRFVVSEPLLGSPTLRLATKNGTRAVELDLAASSPEARTWQLEVEALATDGEGPATLLAAMTDRGANEVTSAVVGTLQLDFTPPTVLAGSPFVFLVPGAGNPLVQPRAAAAGTEVRVTFALSEATAAAPTVSGAALSFALVAQQGLGFTFAATVPASGTPQGPVALQVDAADEAGNAGVQVLTLPGAGLVIDTVPPLPPDTSLLSLERVPFGSSVSPASQTALEGPAGTVEGEGLVRVFAFGNPLAGELMRIDTSSQRVVPRTVIAGLDVPLPFVEFVDLAGNRSPPVAVSRQHLVATFSPLSPPELTATAVSLEGAFHAPRFPAVPRALLAQQDDAGVSVEGQGRWVQTSALPAPPEVDVLVTDLTNGQLLGVSPSSVARFDGERWVVVNPTDPEMDGTPTFNADSRFVDAREQGVLAFESQRVWRWMGSSWKRLPVPPGTLDTIAAVVFDSDQREVLAVGHELGAPNAAMWRLTAPGWERLSAPTLMLTPGRRTGALYSAALRGVQVMAGTELWRWTRATNAFTLVPRAPPALLPLNSGHFYQLVESGNDLLAIASSLAKVYRFDAMGWADLNAAAPGFFGTSSVTRSPFDGQALVSLGPLGQRQTWRFDGVRWVITGAAYDGGLRGGGFRYFPIAYTHPTLGHAEVVGGVGSTTAVARDDLGFTGLDGGGFPLPFQGTMFAFSPNRGLAFTTGEVPYTWEADGGWRVAGAATPVTPFGALSWNPRSGRFLHRVADGGTIVELEWTDAGFSFVAAGSPDAGFAPLGTLTWSNRASDAGSLVLLDTEGLTTWVRDPTWRQLPTTTPQLADRTRCTAVDPATRSTWLFTWQQAYFFTGAGWAPLSHAPAADADWGGHILGCFAVWDRRRGRLLASEDGSAFSEYDPAFWSRPAVELKMPFAVFSLPGASVRGGAVTLRAGASGFSPATFGARLDGVRLDVWRDGAWVTLATTSAPADAPAVLSAPLTAAPSPEAFSALGATSVLHLRVAPLGTNNGTEMARVFVDSVEVSLDVTAP